VIVLVRDTSSFGARASTGSRPLTCSMGSTWRCALLSIAATAAHIEAVISAPSRTRTRTRETGTWLGEHPITYDHSLACRGRRSRPRASSWTSHWRCCNDRYITVHRPFRNDAFHPPPVHSSRSVWMVALQGEEAEATSQQLDIALAVLLDQEAEVWKTAAGTIMKMLANLLREPGNDKFRRIRISNPAFQSK
jgi:hypothetical protein